MERRGHYGRDFSPLPSAAKAKTALSQYEVLNPWAEVDPNGRGISPGLTLEGKKIGLFGTYKGGSPIRPRLKKAEGKVPDRPDQPHSTSLTLPRRVRQSKFESWLKGLDAVVAA
jgi:hypothetical protein